MKLFMNEFQPEMQATWTQSEAPKKRRLNWKLTGV